MNGRRTVIILAALALGACSGEPGSTESSRRSSGTEGAAAAPAPRALTDAERAMVDKAGAVARAIEANPDGAAQILQQHGLTQEQFEGMLYDIAADPDLTAAYTARLGG